MGNKESRSNSGYYYDSRSYDSRSFRSSSNRSSFSENYHDHERKGTVQSKYSKIGDDYSSLEQVTNALAQAGLESSNLIVGIDFTKSNEWTGARSFNRKSLHHLEHTPNPYEQAISIIGRTLSSFNEDNLIPCFGFGDATTHDQEVFSFYADNRPCEGFEEVLSRYRDLVLDVHLSG
ncbi:E3 ubiquitin-protein ligase RGLG2-like [Rhodamnia argentea]|uniref:E3 ubiquitin-protein ligase RGLG2-like n=1 Tax=Rhodamnia argentea TaxID=178133 RepID=A0ABM3HW32_9MYRT|nr:E3 ubiquitin-protein ligase RGLG2-like [Rhodamnia argentea]